MTLQAVNCAKTLSKHFPSLLCPILSCSFCIFCRQRCRQTLSHSTAPSTPCTHRPTRHRSLPPVPPSLSAPGCGIGQACARCGMLSGSSIRFQIRSHCHEVATWSVQNIGSRSQGLRHRLENLRCGRWEYGEYAAIPGETSSLRMVKQGVQPGVLTFNSLINACAKVKA